MAVPGNVAIEGGLRALNYRVQKVVEKGHRVLTEPGSTLPILENGVPKVQQVGR